MEAFGLIDAGAWSVVPPLLALALALITKEVYSSLTIGIFTGMVIYTFTASGPGIDPLIQAFTMVPRMMGAQIADNALLLLFLALLGALVVLVALAGGSRAYGAWVTQHVKSARLAKMLTALLGVLVFVDDYFNCMTVGAVMRPVTDRFRISHEKLAWIIDSSAAPVCIIAPVSSWAVAVGGYLGENGFSTFVASIPYNFYALATIVFVFFICASNMDFGPMRIAEQRARACGAPDRSASASVSESCGISSDEAEAPDAAFASAGGSGSGRHDADQGLVEFDGMKVSDKGTVLDLVVPIATLIVSSIVGMLYVGGFFQGADFATAVGVDPIAGLCIGAATALIAAAAMYLPRGLTTLSGYMAWSLGGVCRYIIGTGPFVSDVLNGLGVGLEFLPAVIFAVSAFIGFSMGTSWGTIALVLPIVTGVFDPSDPLFLVAVGATLGGAVYGDHISPISDTTILSSTSAKCALLDHVSTQTPYATIVFAAGSIAYLVTGFAHNPWVGLVLTIVLSIATFVLLAKRDAAKVAAAGAARREGA